MHTCPSRPSRRPCAVCNIRLEAEARKQLSVKMEAMLLVPWLNTLPPHAFDIPQVQWLDHLIAWPGRTRRRKETRWHESFFFFVCVFGWQFWSCMRLTLSPAKNVWISQPPGDPASSGTARRAGFKDWAALASPAERGICASKQLENCPCSLFVPKFLHALIYLHSCIYIMYVTVCRWTQGIDTIWYNNSSMNAIFIMPRAWNTLVNITS